VWQKGHIAPNCTEPEEEDVDEDKEDSSTDKTSNKKQKGKKHVTLACVTSDEILSDSDDSDFGFCNVSTKLNLRSMILLDNQSTVDIFCNKKLLKDIHVSDEAVTVHGNGGALTTNKRGTLKNHGEVWYHEDAITNILSLKNVRSKFLLTYVSHPQSIFTVHKPDGSINQFRMHQDGLHYFDTKARSSVYLSPVSAEVQPSSSQVLQDKLRESSLLHSKAIESFHAIPNFPIPIADVDQAKKDNHPSLQDLSPTVSGKPISYLPVSTDDFDRVEKVSGSSLPISMRQLLIHPQSDCIQASDSILAELPCNSASMSKVPFLVTVSDHPKFTIAEPFISGAMSLIPDAHHNLMWLNAFPFRNGVSHSMNPRSFVSGVPLEFKLHFQLVCGSHGPAKPSSFVPPFAGNRYKAAAPLLLQSEPLHHLNLLSVKHRSAPEFHLCHSDANVKAPLLAELNLPAPIPSPVLESITLAAVIDATEGHEVVTLDVSNDFVQAILPRSFSKRAKHLKRCYLFVSNNILKGYRSIECSPTIWMMAIPFTKALPAKLFVKFRRAIMNLSDK